jgi:predicted nucleic acid-binding protein
MADRLLLDTDVLIDYLRDQPDAVAYVESLTTPLLVSAITVAELYAGVRDDTERSTLDSFVSANPEVGIPR